MKLAGYQAIAAAIRERIVSGGYTPREKIPCIRQFASAFRCNKLTIQRAFGCHAVRRPHFPGAISLSKASHLVTLREDGPDLDHLQEISQAPIRLFYTMPTVHNPTGIACSLEKKRAVSRLARKHDFLIIEDDCLSEFRQPQIPRFIDHRRAQLTAAIESLNHLTALPHQAGYSLWVRSDRKMSDDPVPWCRGKEFSFSPEMRQYACISFMHLQDDMFHSGVEYLLGVLDAAADGVSGATEDSIPNLSSTLMTRTGGGNPI